MEVPSALNTPLQQRNQRLAWQLLLVAVFFAGFGFALVPLYDAFCRLTGFNGRTNAVAAVQDKNTQIDLTRWVNVEFLSHTMPGVGIGLAPAQFSMRVRPGEVIHTHYVVTNRSDAVFVGQAVPSVTPAVAAPYFQKIECFCFNQQTFQPGEERTLPVVFVVNPDLGKDLGTVTLSYTFFEAPKPKV
ncbi:MAG: cytochrome c oxidase assembly protein [Burkholderiales bacterium]|nr:cytochrome c oxidase assembly protein [Burkholderiales bacterium]MBK9347024.1 cytochrome c oxidase assembly protein [Burkholderiales bacterium]